MGHILAEKSIVSYVSVLGINHFEVYGGHYKMATMSMNNVIYFGNYEGCNHLSDLLLYILELLN